MECVLLKPEHRQEFGTDFPRARFPDCLSRPEPDQRQFLTFDVFDEYRNQSAVYTANLHTGELSPIATVEDGFGAPGYTGDDSALVFSQRDPRVSTGFSLVRQPLQDETDHMTPRGQPSIWLGNADFGVIYRRAGRHAGLTGVLENPLTGSFQSGVGLFSGWACLTGPRGEPPSPSVPEVAERYFYDALEHSESSVDNRGNWWARNRLGESKLHITGQTTVQEVADQVRRFTISYVDDDGYDRTEFYETILGGSGIFTIDIGEGAVELDHDQSVKKHPATAGPAPPGRHSHPAHGSPLMSSQARP